MKIRTKINVSLHTCEYTFTDDSWCSVCVLGDTGSWEYQEEDGDDETYQEGGLWLEGENVVDYDGCACLPEQIVIALKDMGYNTGEIEVEDLD